MGKKECGGFGHSPEKNKYQYTCCCDDDHEQKDMLTECILFKCQGMREEHLSFAETGAYDQERGEGPTRPGYRGPTAIS